MSVHLILGYVVCRLVIIIIIKELCHGVRSYMASNNQSMDYKLIYKPSTVLEVIMHLSILILCPTTPLLGNVGEVVGCI